MSSDRHPQETPRPFSAFRFLRSWIFVGGQSFGGGVATLALIRRMAVEEERWISEEEFTRDWAICQMAPGINLFALTILIGKRVAGAGGIFLSLLGLLLPTAALTVLLTAFYAEIRHSAVIEAALRGIIPATVGLGLVTSHQMVRPILQKSREEGRGSQLFSLCLLIGCSALSLLRFPVITILLVAAALSAWYQWKRRSKDVARDESGA